MLEEAQVLSGEVRVSCPQLVLEGALEGEQAQLGEAHPQQVLEELQAQLAEAYPQQGLEGPQAHLGEVHPQQGLEGPQAHLGERREDIE